MTENEEIDREREWLLRQRDNGLVHDQIVALIGGSRSAVTKNLNTIDDGGNLAMPLRRKIIAYLDRQEREAAERRQAAIDEEAERKRAEAILRRRREKERIRKAKRAAARQLIDALKASLKNLEATILQALRTVNERLEKAGIDTGGRIHGDGVIYARTLEGFRYADSGAEQVAFAPPSHRFPCGLTGEELRRGISAGQRRKRFLVPAGTERPAFIGVRPGNLVKLIPYPDDRPFWGELSNLIGEWRQLFRRKPSWWEERELPELPTDADVTWYRRVLEIETRLLREGLRFEQSIIDWGGSVDSARAVLDDLERRVRYRDILLERRARRKAILERVRQVAAATCAVVLLATLVIAPVLLWDVFLADAVRSVGEFLLAVVNIVLTPFVLLFKALWWLLMGIWWLLTGIWWIVTAIVRALVAAYHGIVWFVKTPWLVPLLAFVVTLISFLPVEAKSSRDRQNPARRWFIVVGIISALVMFTTLIYWLFNAPFPEIEKLFQIP